MAPEDTAPASQLIADRLRAQIISGSLARGAKLLSVRDLAIQEDVAPGTAQAAYDILKDAGLIYTSPGRGTFVRDEFEVPHKPNSADYQSLAAQLSTLAEAVTRLTGRVDELEESVRHGQG
ncbi:GntR family transcriptional regulator [Streptomyces sp. NPDC051940]|uniref:GntR family transcriptional regulator n=1 Tax=Streptomyces sp. NPDC051940 TaxID=3155675 RepID=UPI00344A3FEB